MLVLILQGNQELGLGLTAELLPVIVAMASLGAFAARHRYMSACITV